MKKTAITLALALAATVAGAAPHFYTGNELLAKFDGDPADRAVAHGYVAGAADVLSEEGMVCVPSGVTLRQMTDMVIKVLRDLPADRHSTAKVFVHGTLLGAFPCAKKPASTRPAPSPRSGDLT